MIDIKWIRQNPDAVRRAVRDKHLSLDVDALLAADQRLLDLRRQAQNLETQRNANAKAVPRAAVEARAALIQKGKEIGLELQGLLAEQQAAEAALQTYLWLVPLPPSPEAPMGATDEENVELRRWGSPPVFGFPLKDQVQLLRERGWAEFERIAQVAGTRSYALKNEAVLLEMALHRFAIDRLFAKGFTPMSVPAMARESAFYGTGHFPLGREQAYALAGDDLFLTGTSEVAINSLHAGEIVPESELPLRYAAFSPCFRREAGSGGKDTRGLIRVHQFMKVEQYVLCKNDPAESERWHHELLKISEEIVQALELPYRVVDVCTGDMGPGKFRQYDLEAWIPSEGKYRETHSCSALHDWQARRTDLRYRDAEGTVHYCHTLNNTAVATPRLLVPLLENHQQADGGIRIPEALRAYLGGKGVL